MRIGFDAKRAFNNNTGLGNYSRFILDELSKFTHQKIEVFAFTPKIKKGLFDSFPAENIILAKTKYLKFLWRSLFIKKDIKNKKIDIYHGLTGEIPFFLNALKIKKIVTIHDLIFLKLPKYYNFVDVLIYKFKFKYACNNSDKIIAISKQTKMDIMKHFDIPENKIEIVYQSINNIYRKTIPSFEKQEILKKYDINKPFFLSVGTLEPRKNQLSIIKAFEKLQNNDFELVLIGRGKKYREILYKYILDHGLKNVKILSNVETLELPAIYQSCFSFVYISEYEGFGIPIVEALASQKPILAAYGSCLEEAGGDGAIYVNPESMDDIASGLVSLIENEKLRNKLIENGKTHLEKFDPETLTIQLIAIYKNLYENDRL
jgi:glycosyltransferase involved in cell wall biosynthesis